MENPELQEYLQSEAEKDSKSRWMERVYKSKTARALALMGALGLGAEFWNSGKKESVQPSASVETTAEGIEFGDLSKNFSSRIEIPNQEGRYILHISQIHGADNLEDTKKIIDPNEVIRSQKDLEMLILELKEKKGTNEFYAEGVLPDFLSVMNSVKNQLAEVQQKEGNKALHYRILALVNTVQEQENLPDRHKAYLLQILENKLQSFAEPEDPFLQKLQNHPLLGENKYLWGAAVKLYAEGKIDLIPAEDADANAETFRAYSFLEKFQDNKKVFQQRQDIRDKAAIETITTNPDFKQQKIIPLVYGEGHDFKDNIVEYNEHHDGTSIGLIKIERKRK